MESWNFGGILADDMGLGKTLQMIAVLLAAKLEGKTGTSLIVTPASLVFNWGEEFKKFAPELKVTLAAGTQAERQKRLEESVHSDVLITSYDLLKRDAALYEGREFLYQVLDEAPVHQESYHCGGEGGEGDQKPFPVCPYGNAH